MNPTHSFKIIFAATLGALAIFALPSLAVAKDGNDDRIPDRWENAGRIESFDAASGELVIELFGGETASGLVTGRTRIKCEDEHSPDVSVRGGENEPGDDRGGRHGGRHHGEKHHNHHGGRQHHHHHAEPGDDRGGEGSGHGTSHSGPSGHDDNGVGANCTTSDLIPGAVVEEAGLELEHGVATFDEVELAHSS